MDSFDARKLVMQALKDAGLNPALRIPFETEIGAKLGSVTEGDGPLSVARRLKGRTIWNVHPQTGARIVGIRYTDWNKFEVVTPKPE